MLSTDLLQRCERIEPRNAEWATRLGTIYFVEMQNPRRRARRNWAAAMAHSQYRRAINLCQDDEDRFAASFLAAIAAFEAGDHQQARGHAERLQSLGPGQLFAWGRGAAIYHGNLMLARVALVEGKIEEVENRLIAAFAGHESAAHSVFVAGAASMGISRDLLERGERELAITYLGMCLEHFPEDRNRLEGWISEIERGHMPHFGANLFY